MARLVKLIVGVLLGLYLILQLLSFGFQRKAHLRAPERFVVFITTPGQRVVESVIEWCGDVKDHYFALVGTSRLNEQLMTERDELKTQLLKMKEIQAENQRLRDLINLGQTQKLELVGAEQIAMGPSPYERVARIRKGKASGLTQGMAVLHPRGVVGQVIELTDDAADVLLLVDRASAIDVVSLRSHARGILRGYTFQELRFEYLPRNEDIQVGDEVVTSGLDGVYPSGIPVGVVTSVNKATEAQLFLTASVKPHVDFGHLDEVAVVVGAKLSK